MYISFTLMNVAHELLMRELDIYITLTALVLISLLSALLVIMLVLNIIVNTWNYVEEFDILNS